MFTESSIRAKSALLERRLSKIAYWLENDINGTVSKSCRSIVPSDESKKFVESIFSKIKICDKLKEINLEIAQSNHYYLKWSTQSELSKFCYSGIYLVIWFKNTIATFNYHDNELKLQEMISD